MKIPETKNCLNCLNIENCRLRHLIRNPEIKTCNYAKEGCRWYKGETPRGTDKDMVLAVLRDANEPVDVKLISLKTGLPIETKSQRQIIWNAINRLIGEGFKIEKKKTNEGINYKLKA